MAAYELEPLPKFAQQAVAAARKTVELDGNLAEAHASLGFALATFAGEWAEAETSFRRAIRINPGYATARQWYASSFLVLFGRLDEASQQMEEASSLDPVSAVIHYDLGRVFTYRREFERAAQQFRKAIELDSTYARSHGELGFALEQAGELEAARKKFEKAVEIFSIALEWPFRRVERASHSLNARFPADARKLRRRKRPDDPPPIHATHPGCRRRIADCSADRRSPETQHRFPLRR
jgi:tetratricopeptide (TPR) repeat protein